MKNQLTLRTLRSLASTVASALCGTRLRTLVLAASLAAVAGVATARAQVKVGTIFERWLKQMATAQNYGDQVVFGKMDYCKRGTPDRTTNTLIGGTDYIIIAMGDGDRVTDLDLELHNEAGQRVAADTDETNTAIVRFRPRQTGSYKFTVTPAAMRADFQDAFYGLVIVRDEAAGSSPVPVSSVVGNLAQVLDSLEESGAQHLYSHIAAVSRGGSYSTTYVLEARETFVICAVGDGDRVQDVDVTVEDENGNVVGKDDDESNLGVVKVTPKWTGRFTIRVTAASLRSGVSDAFHGVVIARKS